MTGFDDVWHDGTGFDMIWQHWIGFYIIWLGLKVLDRIWLDLTDFDGTCSHSIGFDRIWLNSTRMERSIQAITFFTQMYLDNNNKSNPYKALLCRRSLKNDTKFKSPFQNICSQDTKSAKNEPKHVILCSTLRHLEVVRRRFTTEQK